MEALPLTRHLRLDSIFMVKEAIRRFDGQLNIKTLWEHLPQKIKYLTYCTIIDYLLYSGTICIDAKGNIGWNSHPEKQPARTKEKSL